MDKFQLIKKELDRELGNLAPNVAIGFGLELFVVFGQRGWIALASPDIPSFGYDLPFYNGTHYAFPMWGVPGLEYHLQNDPASA